MKVRKEVREKVNQAIAESPSIQKADVVAMLKEYEYHPDIEKLVEQEYGRTANRLIAAKRDEKGIRRAYAVREAHDTRFVCIENTDDPADLRRVIDQLRRKRAGIQAAERKVFRREQVVNGQMVMTEAMKAPKSETNGQESR